MRIILNGADGRMGREVIAACSLSGDEVVFAADKAFKEGSLSACVVAADVLVDFSSPEATESVINYALNNRLPVVMGTTGQTAAQLKIIKAAAKSIPVFLSANTSTGIGLVAKFVEKTLERFPKAEVEIVEAHHSGKADCPSGTAKLLIKSTKKRMVYGRRGKRKEGEVGVCSLRYGGVCGIHEVIMALGGEIITIKHEATDRKVFADGALSAARFIVAKTKGVYDVTDIINET